MISVSLSNVCTSLGLSLCATFAASLLQAIRSAARDGRVEKPFATMLALTQSEDNYWRRLAEEERTNPSRAVIGACTIPLVQEMNTFRLVANGALFTTDRYRALRALPPKHSFSGLHRRAWTAVDLNVEEKKRLLSSLEIQGVGDSAGDPRQFARFIPPPSDPHFTRKGNPVLAGKQHLVLLMLREETRLRCANDGSHIFVACHLYNALLYYDDRIQRWPALEQIIDIHIKPIFLGERPREVGAMLRRALLAYGCRTHEVARSGNFSSHTNKEDIVLNLLQRRKVDKCHLRTSPVMAAYLENLHDREESPQTMHRIRTLLASKKASAAANNATSFLEALRGEAATFQARFDIDYIEITRSCEALLYAIYEAAAGHMERLRYSVQQGDGIWRDGRDKTNSFQIMVHVLMELNAADSLQRRSAKGSHASSEPTTPLTDIAASVLARFIDGEGLA
jgi:hypothetical protein